MVSALSNIKYSHIDLAIDVLEGNFRRDVVWQIYIQATAWPQDDAGEYVIGGIVL